MTKTQKAVLKEIERRLATGECTWQEVAAAMRGATPGKILSEKFASKKEDVK